MKQLIKEVYKDIKKHNKDFAKRAIEILLNNMIGEGKITSKEAVEILKEISEEEGEKENV